MHYTGLNKTDDVISSCCTQKRNHLVSRCHLEPFITFRVDSAKRVSVVMLNEVKHLKLDSSPSAQNDNLRSFSKMCNLP